MVKRLFTFFDTLFDVVVAIIGIPQIIYFMSTRTDVGEYYRHTSIEAVPAYVCLITLLFSSYTFMRLAVTFNKPLRERFLESGAGNSLKNKLVFLTDQTEFWLKAGIIAVIYLLLPFNWTVKPLAVLANAVTEKDKVLCLAFLLPILFVLAVLAHLSAYKRWGMNNNPDAYTKKQKRQEMLYAAIAYFGGASMFIAMLPALFPILTVVIRLLNLRRIIIIAILLCLPFVYRLLRAVFKRRAFLHRLKELCAENGYTVSEIQYPYLSLFMFLKGESFSITINEKVYSCKLISARKRNAPIALTANGELTFIYTVSMRGTVLHQRTVTHKLCFESENPKILIINPVPKNVYEFHSGKLTELDNGIEVGGYKFFAATGFLHAAELNVLDK